MEDIDVVTIRPMIHLRGRDGRGDGGTARGDCRAADRVGYAQGGRREADGHRRSFGGAQSRREVRGLCGRVHSRSPTWIFCIETESQIAVFCRAGLRFA